MSGRAYSPPPPPQRRRSSLTMSGTTLDTLLRSAPVPRSDSSGSPAGMQLRSRTRSAARINGSRNPPDHPVSLNRSAHAVITSGATSGRRSSEATALRSELTRRVMESLSAGRSATASTAISGLPQSRMTIVEALARRSSSRLSSAPALAPPSQTQPRAAFVEAFARRSSPRLSARKRTPVPEQKRPAKRLKSATEPLEPCCICMNVPTIEDAATIDCNCQNSFCFGCIQEWSKTENSCPLCKARFSTIESASNSAKVKTVNQRSEAGAALEGLLASLTANTHHERLGRFLLRGVNGTDEDPFMPGFMNVILRSTVTTHLHLAQFGSATNPVGRSADTPIELSDSDDEDDLLVL